jgi:hypothetical protein
MSKKLAAFFLGSGISNASGAPAVHQLTRATLEGGWEAHTDLRFYPSSSQSTKEAERAQEFLRILYAQIAPHLRNRDDRDPNYEDLFDCAVQIVWDETAEVVNPLIAQASQFLREATEHLFRNQHAHIDNNAFASLAERASDLVQWVVFHELAKAKKLAGLHAISEVARITRELDIFTLNHDTLLERELERSRIPYADGFGDRWGDALRFSWSWNDAAAGVRLYKLHGSTDWYLFRSKAPAFDQYGKLRGDPEHCRDENGNRLSLLQPHPHFLTGTMIKERRYGITVTGECFAEFRERLSRHQTLICCGYGWRDKGINTRINQWLRDRAENKLIILHKGGIDGLKAKRFWFFKWGEYLSAKKIFVLPRWLSECRGDELERFFD